MGKRFTALVRGPSPVLPRGFVWIIPVWYAVIAALIYHFGRLPRWYLLVALAGLGLALVIHLTVLVTLRSNAFVADSGGITLGLRAGARRRGRRRRQNADLPWTKIEQVSVAGRHYGARLDIVLGPSAPLRRTSAARRAAATAVTVLLPVCCLVRAPGLLAPRRSGPDYRVRLCDVDPERLRSALTALADPAGVQVTLAGRWRPRGRGRVTPVPAAPAALSR